MRRGVLAVVLVALAACAPASASPSVRTVAIGIHYSAFSLDTIEVEPGETVRFVVTNTDPIDHEFIVGDDWKIAARLPIPAGELLLNRIRSYGWVEIQGEKHYTAIRLTPAGLQAMRSAI